MKKIYQYRNVTHVEYIPKSGKLTMKIDQTDDDYISQVNEIDLEGISNKYKHVKHLSIQKESLAVDFLHPITCNLETGRYENKLICDVELDGNNTTAFVEKLPDLADKLL